MTNVILVTPNLKIPGGVTEFNKILLNYSNYKIAPFTLLGAGREQNKLVKSFTVLLDFFHFVFIIPFTTAKIVHLGPSLSSNSIIRDGVLCLFAKLFNKKVYIHWHGWNPANKYLLEGLSLKFVKSTIFKADHIKFLSSTFAEYFIQKGYSNKTSLGNTFIDDNLIIDHVPSNKKKQNVNILFLSTVSINKGIYIAIEQFIELSQRYNITLTVAGVGPELEKVRKLINKDILDRVTFTGHITGQDKINVYKNADIYIFPSQYEGMPTSVIEAMSYGLPVICNAVGALPDFFENEKMGYIVEKTDKESFKLALERLISDDDFRHSIGIFNHQYAIMNFLASKAVTKIDQDYKDLVCKSFLKTE